MSRPTARRRRRSPEARLLPAAFLLILTALAAGCCALARGGLGDTAPGEPLSLSAGAYPPGQEDYLTLQLTQANLARGELILVNGQHPYSFDGREEERLVALLDHKGEGYKVKDGSVRVDPVITKPLNALLGAFYEAQGMGEVNVVSGYRSYDYQQQLLDSFIAQKGEAAALAQVAPPGGSEHHTALAVDLGIYYDNGLTGDYNGRGKLSWIAQNAPQYGFILRYTAQKQERTGIMEEPWHFRYVGRPHAAIMAQQGLCLEEYVDCLRQYDCDRRLRVELGEERYEVYFAKGLLVPVPKSGQYSLSGNNVDGFIVTVKMT